MVVTDLPPPPITTCNMTNGRDVWMHEQVHKVRPHAPCEHVSSEDPMFILYTSGSTGTVLTPYCSLLVTLYRDNVGKPKGVAHTTAGYLLNAKLTVSRSFDLDTSETSTDIYCCAADCGWVTGHTYIVYGPLLNGATTIMFESIPTYPNPYRCVRVQLCNIVYHQHPVNGVVNLFRLIFILIFMWKILGHDSKV